MNLGRVADHSAGQLRLDTDVLDAKTYSPSSLALATSQPVGTVEPVRDAAGALRQVKAPESLTDIVVLDANSYEARFYTLDQVGAQDATSKIYTVSGSPFVVYTFENPDSIPGDIARLRITETRGAFAKSDEYVYNSTGATWALNQDGLREESLVTTTDANGDMVKTRTVTDGSNHVVSKTALTYHTFAWGLQPIREVLDPDGAALTISYSYYESVSTDDPNYRKLMLRTEPNGAWTRYTYDTGGNVLKTFRPFLDASPAATDESLCRVTENIYDAMPDADGDGQTETRITSIERVTGQETGRHYRIDWSGAVVFGGDVCRRRSEIQCMVPGSTWNSSSNQVTETLYYSAAPLTDRTRRIVNANGTASIYTYVFDSTGQLTSTVKLGQPNGTGDDVIAGQRLVTTTGLAGQVVGESITDIRSNLLLSSWTTTIVDALGRPTRMDYNDGTYVTRTYACCGLDTERDRTGMVSNYTYDVLGRQTSASRGGMSSRTTYDADGRALSVSRVGTNGTEQVLETHSYDLAGRETSHRDSLNRQTGITESFDVAASHLIRTTSLPGGATRIETYAADGSLLSVSGTAAAPINEEYGVDSDGVFTKTIRVGSSGELTEWVKSYTDFAGRPSKTVYADGATTQSAYNSLGQLAKTVDQDGVTTLFAYNALGDQEVVALDLNRNGAIDYDGTDRITKSVTQVTTAHGTTVRQTITSVWGNDGQPVVVSTSETSADGRSSWSTVNQLTTTSTVAYPTAGVRQETTTTPDGVQAIRQFNQDRLVTNTVLHPSLGTLASATYAYDAQGRLQVTTDARLASTTYTYYDDDQIKSVTTADPDPARTGPGYDSQTTSYTYDSAGRLSQTILPDTTTTTQEYYATGQLKKSSGSRTYPQLYTYDAQGRLKTLTTWQDYGGNTGQAVTTWNYDPARGWLNLKKYADNTGPSYTYFASGRLKTRTWARGLTTTYAYNNAGDLSGINYSDTTAPVILAYDSRGRLVSTTDASGTLTRSYHASGALQNETYGPTGLSGC